MPVGPGRYRYKRGTSMRLHFTPGGMVNEAKNMDTGATHTPAEFRADAAAKPRLPRKPRQSPVSQPTPGLMKINVGRGKLDT